MAIRLVDAIQIYKILISLGSKLQKNIKVCSIGYPDLLFDNTSAQKNFNTEKFSQLCDLNYKSDFMKSESNKSYVQPESFFKALNASFDVIDVVKHRGNEILVDLNYINATHFLAQSYDFVIDNGSLEHCFNIGEALINVARLVAPNGFVYHMNPLSMINHGFYNISPTFYYDFYSQNNFNPLYSFASGLTSERIVEISPFGRLNLNKTLDGEELSLSFAAQKLGVASDKDKALNNKENFVYPIQSKYKKLLDGI